jgi:thioredoxin reductase (NADPH)
MRALQQARRLGAEILVTRSITRIDPAARQVHLDGGDVLRAKTIILACGVSWRHLSVEGFDGLIGKGVFYGAARSEAANTHGLDVHIVGAGNSAGQAAMFFANHARSVTILCRGATLAKTEGSGMSRYLIDQLAARSNVRVLYRTEVVRAHGTNSLEAIDVRNSDTGETTRLESGGLFLFIVQTPKLAGSRPRSHSTGAATCSPVPTWALTRNGTSTAIGTSSRRAWRASSRASTFARVR